MVIFHSYGTVYQRVSWAKISDVSTNCWLVSSGWRVEVGADFFMLCMLLWHTGNLLQCGALLTTEWASITALITRVGLTLVGVGKKVLWFFRVSMVFSMGWSLIVDGKNTRKQDVDPQISGSLIFPPFLVFLAGCTVCFTVQLWLAVFLGDPKLTNVDPFPVAPQYMCNKYTGVCVCRCGMVWAHMRVIISVR